MFSNYLIIAFRSLLKNKLSTAINIGGLALSLTALLLLTLEISSEKSYDQWVADKEKIFRLETTYQITGRNTEQRSTSMLPARDLLLQDYPEIESSARVQPFWISLSRDNILFNERIVFTDPEFLEIFSLKLIEGDINTALSSPNSLVLTQSIAEKYFGQQPALGETLIVDGDVAYKVTAIIEDLPNESHLNFALIAPYSAPNFYSRQYIENDWDITTAYTYIKLKDASQSTRLEASFPDFVQRYVPVLNIGGSQLSGTDAIRLHLRPITDIHLHSLHSGNMKPPGSIGEIYALIIIALLLITIACVNFINLTSAQFTTRWNEIAIRKICGAQRRHLVFLFLCESYLLVIVAALLAYGMADLLLPFFNELRGKNLSLLLLYDSQMLPLTLITLVLIGLIGGLAPTWFIASARPGQVLNQRMSNQLSGGGVRSALVVFQFAISVGLIIMTLVVYQQTQYAQSMNTGFEIDNRLVLSGVRRGPEQTPIIVEQLKTALNRHPDILATSGSSSVPGFPRFSTASARLSGSFDQQELTTSMHAVDDAYFSAYGVRPVAGREFSDEFPSDQLYDTLGEINGSVLINETAARQLQLDPENALTQRLHITVGTEDSKPLNLSIVGVVPDLHIRSARDSIEPQIYFRNIANFNYITIHVARQSDEVMEHIQQAWQQVLPDQEISQYAVSDLLRNQYSDEQSQSLLLTISALLATVIASLGLYGMAAFIVQRRRREMGVRKVFGASLKDLLKLTLLRFSKPVIIANLIAWPVAWKLTQDWLQGFAYRIDLGIQYFLIAGVLALLIAGLTIISHSWSLARTSPAKVLRHD